MRKCAVAIIILSLCATALAFYNLFLVITHPVKYKSDIVEISRQFDLEPSLVASVINVESSYKKHATSSKNAKGLMQVKDDTAEYLIDYYNLEYKLTEETLFDPKENIYFGCMYIRYLLNKFEDQWTALASYNAGETRVRVWLKDSQFSLDSKTLTNIPYRETRDYVEKIRKNIKFYSRVY